MRLEACRQGDQFSFIENSSTRRKNCNYSAHRNRCLPHIVAEFGSQRGDPQAPAPTGPTAAVSTETRCGFWEVWNQTWSGAGRARPVSAVSTPYFGAYGPPRFGRPTSSMLQVEIKVAASREFVNYFASAFSTSRI